MIAVVLVTAVVAVLVVFDGHPDRWAMVGVFLAVVGLWCGLLTVPAVLRRRR